MTVLHRHLHSSKRANHSSRLDSVVVLMGCQMLKVKTALLWKTVLHQRLHLR